MSIVCCCNFPEAVVIATDTRVVDASRGERRVASNADIKLFHWGHGWFAGVGHSPTLGAATEELRKRPIAAGTDVDAALQDVRARVFLVALQAHPELATDINATAAILTFDGRIRPEAGCWRPALGDELPVCQKGQLALLWPRGTTPEAGAAFRASYEGLVGGNATTVEDCVPICVGLARMIRDVAVQSAEISDRVDIGIHLGPSYGDDRFVRFRGSAADITACSTMEDLSEYGFPIFTP